MEDHFWDYTDFTYNTYASNEYNPLRYTFGSRMDMVYYFKRRFRWPGINLSYKNGRVRGEYYYNDQHRLERQVDYEYEDVHRPDYSMCIYVESLQPGTFYGIYTHVNREFFSATLLKRKTLIESDEAYQKTSWRELYEYDDFGYLTRHTQVLTGGDSLQTSYRYLENTPSLVTDKIQEMHREGKRRLYKLFISTIRCSRVGAQKRRGPLLSVSLLGRIYRALRREPFIWYTTAMEILCTYVRMV